MTSSSLFQSNPELTDEERAKIMRNLTAIYLAQNRRVDITLANTGQQSVQLYPFNAHDAGAFLSEKAQAHAKKQPKSSNPQHRSGSATPAPVLLSLRPPIRQNVSVQVFRKQ